MRPDHADDLLRAALLAERVRWPDRITRRRGPKAADESAEDEPVPAETPDGQSDGQPAA